MKTNKRIALTFISVLFTAHTATAADPTTTPEAFADSLKTHLMELRAITIKALVVGADGNGVAVISLPDKTDALVRKNTSVTVEAAGIPVNLKIKSVSELGIEIDTSTVSEKLFIPGAFRPSASTGDTHVAPENQSGNAAGDSATRAPLNQSLLKYLEFNDVSARVAALLIADQSGINTAVSHNAAEESVSLFLRNVSAEKAVEEICNARNLWFRRDERSGIIRISTIAEYEQSLSSFREEATETFTLLYPNVLEVASVIYGLYPDRVFMTLGEKDILDDEKNELSRRFERLRVIDNGSSSSLLSVNPGSVSSAGSGSSRLFNSYDQRRASTYYRDQQTSQETFANLSAQDVKRIEEAREAGDAERAEALLTAYRDKAPGIFVTISRRNNIIIVRTGDAKAMENIRKLIRRLDVATPTVLLEMRILSLNVEDGFSSAFEYEFNTVTRSNGNDYHSTAGFPGFNPLAVAGRTDTMSFQMLSEHFNLRIQMLEKEGKAVTLATPTLVIANNEVSRIFMGEEIPITTGVSLEPQSGTLPDGTTTTVGYVINPNTEMVPVGTTLLVTPNINADRTVTLRLVQDNSEINPSGGSIPYGDSTQLQTYKVDTVKSRRISGTFITQDGMYAAIGGLISEQETLQESRVPFLGRLPLIGFLFRSTEKVKSRSELVILIRPHVITTPADGEAISRRLLEHISTHPAISTNAPSGSLFDQKLR